MPRVFACVLLLGLSACAPAVLRTPQPVEGFQGAFGASLFSSRSPGGENTFPAGYIGLAYGNGWTEVNANLQLPTVRFGLKQRLLEENNLSLEVGAGGYLIFSLTSPPPGGASSPAEFRGIFDVGLLYGLEGWYFAPRYSLVSAGGFDYVSLFQFHVGYAFAPNPLLEVGFHANDRGWTGFSVSLALRSAPSGP